MLETFQKYSGSGLIISLFLLAWIYLFLKEKQKDRRVLFVYVPAVTLLLFFNPIFFRICANLTEDAIYFRFLWLLPITVVIAYCIICICVSLKGAKRLCFAFLSSVIIVVSGKSVYSNPLFSPAENIYHVPQEVVEICDMIRVEGREVMAAFPREFLLYVRQYSPYVCMPYGRDVFNYPTDFFILMESEEIVVSELAAHAKQALCHYIILPSNRKLIGDMSAFDYKVFGQVGEYIIYEDTTIYKGL